MKEDEALNSLKTRTIRLALLGPSNVGKTSLMQCLMQSSFREGWEATQGISIQRHKLTSTLDIVFTDTGGSFLNISLVISMMRDVDLFLLLFDRSKKNSFPVLQKYFDQLIKQYPMLIGQPQRFMMVGNKSDKEIEVEDKEVAEFSEKYKIPYQKISIKENKEKQAQRLVCDFIEKQVPLLSLHKNLKEQLDSYERKVEKRINFCGFFNRQSPVRIEQLKKARTLLLQKESSEDLQNALISLKAEIDQDHTHANKLFKYGFFQKFFKTESGLSRALEHTLRSVQRSPVL